MRNGLTIHAAGLHMHTSYAYICLWRCFMALCIITLLPAFANAAGMPGESKIMRTIRTTIEQEIRDKTCISDSDCGAAVLLKQNGCRMYTPFSLSQANEYKMQALLKAYNGLSLKAARDSGRSRVTCRMNKAEPDTACKRAKRHRTGTCVLS